MNGVKAEPMVAMEFKIGNTEIEIHTDYCQNRTDEEVQQILRRVAADAQQALSAKYRGGLNGR